MQCPEATLLFTPLGRSGNGIQPFKAAFSEGWMPAWLYLHAGRSSDEATHAGSLQTLFC